MELISNILGWVGTIIILSAYFLVSSSRIKPQSKTYQTLNLLGAILIGINVFNETAWPALALQIVWAGIAIKSLTKNG